MLPIFCHAGSQVHPQSSPREVSWISAQLVAGAPGGHLRHPDAREVTDD